MRAASWVHDPEIFEESDWLNIFNLAAQKGKANAIILARISAASAVPPAMIFSRSFSTCRTSSGYKKTRGAITQDSEKNGKSSSCSGLTKPAALP